MKKLCKALALTLCTIMLLSTLTVVGDPGGKTLLTLEEAKAQALKDDTQYKLQESYIQQKLEDYNDLADDYTGYSKGSSVAEKAENRINSQISLDSAYNSVELEVFNKNDIKRKSDYDVTTAYYNVMKAKYSLENAKRTMDLAKKDLDIAKIKLEHGLITKSALTQVENAYKSSQTEYNKAVSDLQNDMATLSKNIGGKLDISNVEIDMTIYMPNVAALDLNKIKDYNIKNNSKFFSLKNALDTAKYKSYLTDDSYDSYKEDKVKLSEKIEDEFAAMKYEAKRDYDDAQYQFDEAVKELDISLKSQYSGIITMIETIENLKKSVENTKTTLAQNSIKYNLGLISKNEFENSESALKDMENQLATSIVNLSSQYLALTQYNYTPAK